jgi:hypothetical protein
MNKSYEEKRTAIVWAESENEAEELIKAEYEFDDPYSLNAHIWSITLSPALGTP